PGATGHGHEAVLVPRRGDLHQPRAIPLAVKGLGHAMVWRRLGVHGDSLIDQHPALALVLDLNIHGYASSKMNRPSAIAVSTSDTLSHCSNVVVVRTN